MTTTAALTTTMTGCVTLHQNETVKIIDAIV
jgi:hypothetical protein